MKRNFILWAIGAFALAAICFGQPPPVNYTLQPNFIFNDGDFTMSVAIADFDLDGDLDAVFGNYDYPYEFDGDNPVNELVGEEFGGLIKVYYNQLVQNATPADPIFDEYKWVSTIRRGTDCAVVGDYNKDAYPDIALGNILINYDAGNDALQGGVSILVNNGDPPWFHDQSIVELEGLAGMDIHCVRWVDLNNDGLLDLACLNVNTKIVYFYLNSMFQNGEQTEYILASAGQFQLDQIMAGFPSLSIIYYVNTIEFGDIDNDGKLDMAVNYRNPTVYFNNGSNPFFYKDNITVYVADPPEDSYCAMFGKYNGQNAIITGSRSISFAHEIPDAGELPDLLLENQFIGNDLYTYSAGVGLNRTWQEFDDLPPNIPGYNGHSHDYYQSVTDIFMADLIGDANPDFLTVSYPLAALDGSGDLEWSRGLSRIYEYQNGDFIQTWESSDPYQSTSLTLGDFDHTDSELNVITLEEHETTGQNNPGLFYIDHNPARCIDSVRIIGTYGGNVTKVKIEYDIYCFDLQNGWVSVNDSTALTSLPVNYTFTAYEVNYKYSTSLDILVGNQGNNIIYYRNDSITVNYTCQPYAPDINTTGVAVPDHPAVVNSQMDTDGAIGFCFWYYDEEDVTNDSWENINLWGTWTDWGEDFPGHYYWNALDQRVKTTGEHNKKFAMLIANSSPIWTTGEYMPQEDAEETDERLRTVDERFKTCIMRNYINRYRPYGYLSTQTDLDDDWGVTVFLGENEPNCICWGYGYFGENLQSVEDIANQIKYNYTILQRISEDLPEDVLEYASPNFSANPDPQGLVDYFNYFYDSEYDAVFKDFCDVIDFQAYNIGGGGTSTQWDYRDPWEILRIEDFMDNWTYLVETNDDFGKTFMTIEWGYGYGVNPPQINWVSSHNVEMFGYNRMRWSLPGFSPGGDEFPGDEHIAVYVAQGEILNGCYFYDESNNNPQEWGDAPQQHPLADPSDDYTKDYTFKRENEPGPDDDEFIHYIRAYEDPSSGTAYPITVWTINSGFSSALERTKLMAFDIYGDRYRFNDAKLMEFCQFGMAASDFDLHWYADHNDYPLYLKEMVVEEKRTFPLHDRWNWVSVNVDPENYTVQGMVDNEYFWQNGAVYNPDAIEDENGDRWPNVSLGDWNETKMYMVGYSQGTTGPLTLEPWGCVIPPDSVISLEGDATPHPPENWVAYFPNEILDIDVALGEEWSSGNSVFSHLVWIQHEGIYYDPQNASPFQMEPGKGYKIWVDTNCDLRYPSSAGPESIEPPSKPQDNSQIASINHFNFEYYTDDVYVIKINSLFIEGEPPSPGDEIAVFTPAGLCVGATECIGDTLVYIVAWKDNSLTEEIDGYQEGETMYFRYWDASAGVEFDLNFTYPIINAVGGWFKFGEGPFASIELMGGNELPSKYQLAQNYPNPFNPSTFICYDLPYESKVELIIYNIMGQKVSNLVNRIQSAGFHHANWNGKDDLGNDVASGIYFYSLKAHSTTGNKIFNENRKMILIR